MGLPPADYYLTGKSDILRIFRNFGLRLKNKQNRTHEKLFGCAQILRTIVQRLSCQQRRSIDTWFVVHVHTSIRYINKFFVVLRLSTGRIAG